MLLTPSHRSQTTTEEDVAVDCICLTNRGKVVVTKHWIGLEHCALDRGSKYSQAHPARLKQRGGGGEANWLNKATPPPPVTQKSDRLRKQNIGPASHFSVHLFAVTVRGLPREIA